MRNLFIFAVVLCIVAVASPLGAQQQCPTGAYPWVDNWGNHICRRFEDQSTATVRRPAPNTCPTGSYPWVDSWGNNICRTFNSTDPGPSQPRTDYYDTSRGCPVGTYPWVDNWGNKVCKRFGN